MKNVVSKVLVMFVMSFTLLVSCSYAAEFGAVPVSVSNPLNSYATANKYGVADYSLSSIFTVVNLYMNNLDNSSYEQAFNEMVSAIQSKNYNIVVGNLGNSDTYSFLVFADNFDIGVYDNKPYFVALDVPHESVVGGSIVNSSYYWSGVTSATCYINKSFFDKITFSTISVKELFYLNGYCWDGESYVYKTGSSGGDSSIITPSVDTNLAGLISAITSSDVVKDNVDGRKEYFIQPYYISNNEIYYKIYFYADVVNLSCFEFVGLDNRYYYDLDKVSVEGIIAKIWDFFNGEKINTRCFSAFYNESKSTYDIYFDGSPLISELKNIDSEKNPIIFTTKDIPYYSYTVDSEGNVIAIANTVKDKKYIEVTDDEGNVVSPIVSQDNSTLSDTTWNRFINIITSIPKKIASAFSEMLGFSKVSLFLGPLITSIAKILGVLLASISFIGRAITFVYTLPTIEDSSAMFTADVETTKGLVFTGNNWGHHFLSGLTRLKNLSWNGINLWSFFEAFVLALLVIFVIKLVRKHYHV